MGVTEVDRPPAYVVDTDHEISFWELGQSSEALHVKGKRHQDRCTVAEIDEQ